MPGTRATHLLTTAVLAFAPTGCAHASGPPRPPTVLSAKQPLPPELAADLVLAAMSDELERSARGLRLPGYEAPYYVSFVVQETEGYEVHAKQAALVSSKPTRQRRAAVDVRIGSYALDNSNDNEPEWTGDDELLEPTNTVPVEDPSPQALRRALWLLTDFRYKQALASYLKLRGQGVYRVDEPNRAPSFSPADVVVGGDPISPLADPRDAWNVLARRLSARLAAQPGMLDSQVQLEVELETRWLVTTEGTRLRSSRTLYSMHATGWIQAPDGMILDAATDLYAPSGAGFMDETRLMPAIDQLATTLSALRDAPLLEPYTGPAIIESAATGVLFHEVLGHRLEGRRRDDDNDGQTFGRTLGQPILPTFLSLVDDPTLAAQGGVPLNGHYAIDDEGVPARRVVLVDHGILRAFLSARRPAPGATRSNGHGRAEGIHRPIARQGNLMLVAHEHVDDAELKRRLIAEAKQQGRPFGLIIRELSGGSTNTSSRGYQAFKGEARQVYKVDLETGRETLVRGVDLVGTPLILLSKIAAVGDRVGIFNGFCGAESGMVPVSAVAPSVFIREIELQRSSRPRARPPVLPPPPSDTTPAATDGGRPR